MSSTTDGTGSQNAIPEAWLDQVRNIAKAYLEEMRYFVDEIGETDVENCRVLLYPMVCAVGADQITIAWADGPGRKQLDPDQGIDTLTEDVITRIQSAHPEMKHICFVIESDDDDDDKDGYEDWEDDEGDYDDE